MGNLLIAGDNYDGLLHLLEEKGLRGKVQLVYIDPPYGTNQNFTFSEDRFATISRLNGGRVAYRDNLTGEDYLKFLSARLRLLRELLAENGSIYLHIDQTMGHYVKVLMDEVFGQENFVNDITRIKCNPKNFSRRGYGNYKDTVLFYSKTGKHIWNDPRQELKISADDPRFRSVDKNGRRYTTTPLHAPGETQNGATGKAWKGLMPPPGRHWRYHPDKLTDLDNHGLIEWSVNGNPRKKIYARDVEKAGAKLQDIWEFKDPPKPKYPTEKNLDMLKMIVEASSNPGDLVLDCFCGSGSTLEAAEVLGRKWIGVDSSELAISITQKRLPNHSFVDLTVQIKESN